jgi:aminopeptidase N
MKSLALRERDAATALMNAQTRQQLTGIGNNYDVKHYQCEWNVDPAVKFISGKVTITYQVVTSLSSLQLDLNKTLAADSVLYKGSKLVFTQNNNNTLTVNFPGMVASGLIENITVFYKGVPDATGLGSFVKGTHAGVPIIWTLSEPYGASDWWPCKDVLTDKADSIDIYITCPDIYKSSSNGLLVSDVLSSGKRISHYKHRYPIATYLVAMACTNYVVNTVPVNINGTIMPFENWTYPESAAYFTGESYGVENALKWFSGYYGDYPFIRERYAQTQFNWGGGMEHQTNSFVVSPQHLLQAHELAHQWFGDKTTCGSWKDIWLNEGFASFSHWLYFKTHDMPTYLGIRQEYHDEVTIDSTGSVYVNDTTDQNRLFSWRWTYVKGSYVLHMLRGMLGDAAFFKAMKDYGNDPATRFGTAKTEDVKRVFEQSTGKNLGEFFKDWIYGQGWPMYQVQWYNNSNGWLNIRVRQKQSHPSVDFFEMPLRLQFKNATRDSTVVVDVQQNGQLFGVKLNFIPDTVLIDPELWLLSKNNTQQKLQVPANSNGIQVSPNPAGNSNWTLLIRNPSQTAYGLQLYNSTGQLLLKYKIASSGADISSVIPNTQLPNGTYLIRINDGTNNIFTQIIIK